jgi:very-short-patch-repair endonuclease
VGVSVKNLFLFALATLTMAGMRQQPVVIRRAQELRRTTTDAERRLWQELRGRQLGFKFRRQAPIANFVADFACPAARLVIELDGGGHGTNEAEARDSTRSRALELAGYRVIRFWNHEVFEHTDNVVERIWNELYGGSPPP